MPRLAEARYAAPRVRWSTPFDSSGAPFGVPPFRVRAGLGWPCAPSLDRCAVGAGTALVAATAVGASREARRGSPRSHRGLPDRGRARRGGAGATDQGTEVEGGQGDGRPPLLRRRRPSSAWGTRRACSADLWFGRVSRGYRREGAQVAAMGATSATRARRARSTNRRQE